MAMRRYETEEAVSLLRWADVLHGHGMSTLDAIRRYCFPDNLARALPFMGRPGAKDSMRPIRADSVPGLLLHVNSVHSEKPALGPGRVAGLIPVVDPT